MIYDDQVELFRMTAPLEEQFPAPWCRTMIVAAQLCLLLLRGFYGIPKDDFDVVWLEPWHNTVGKYLNVMTVSCAIFFLTTFRCQLHLKHVQAASE